VTLAIEADGLVKEYGDVRALDGLSFEVDPGEFFGLLGPNGAGKTTFINVLVGLARATGGRAEVFGYDVETEYREARNRIGLAPQEFNVDRLFPIVEPASRPPRRPSGPRRRSGRSGSPRSATPASTGSPAG